MARTTAATAFPGLAAYDADMLLTITITQEAADSAIPRVPSCCILAEAVKLCVSRAQTWVTKYFTWIAPRRCDGRTARGHSATPGRLAVGPNGHFAIPVVPDGAPVVGARW